MAGGMISGILPVFRIPHPTTFQFRYLSLRWSPFRHAHAETERFQLSKVFHVPRPPFGFLQPPGCTLRKELHPETQGKAH